MAAKPGSLGAKFQRAPRVAKSMLSFTARSTNSWRPDACMKAAPYWPLPEPPPPWFPAAIPWRDGTPSARPGWPLTQWQPTYGTDADTKRLYTRIDKRPALQCKTLPRKRKGLYEHDLRRRAATGPAHHSQIGRAPCRERV